jgi:DNA-binding XRE family transcriptional regulator
MAYLTYEQRRLKYDPLYIDWLDRFVSLRKLRNISRKYVARELGLSDRTYYTKEACISSFKMYELVKAFEVIGFSFEVVVDQVFSHTKRGKRIDY